MGLSVAYRPPTLYDTNADQRNILTFPLPPPSNTTTLTNQGSTNLSPEEIVSYDLGYQGWYLRHRLRIRADLFFNHLSNLIQGVATSPTTTTFMNGGVGDIYGGEAGAELLVTRWLSGFANFSYEEISQTFTGAAWRGPARRSTRQSQRGPPRRMGQRHQWRSRALSCRLGHLSNFTPLLGPRTIWGRFTRSKSRKLQPLEYPGSLQILAREGRSRSHGLQCLRRPAQGTSVRRHDRQPGHGLADGEVLTKKF